jgi:hypothetical protein
MGINVTAEFGLIVRRRALLERNVPLEKVLAAVEAGRPLDCNDDLISFGPGFGQEALDEFSRRLIELGLVYFDDFFEFAVPCPSWCRFQAEAAAEQPAASLVEAISKPPHPPAAQPQSPP